MIWLIARVLLFVGLLVAVDLLFTLLVDTDGRVAIEFRGVTYPPLNPIEFLAALAAAVAVVFLLFKLAGLLVAVIRFLLGDETALSRFWARAKERRGLDALSTGMVALAEGNVGAAEAAARKATRLLGARDLTSLLNAQVAEAKGDVGGAKTHYRLLAKEPETAILGVKGLLAQAVKGGETDRAMKLAEHAFSIRPKDATIQQTLFDLQVKAGAWDGAKKTLAAMARAKTLPEDVARRRGAVLSLEVARDARAAGETAPAVRAADEAVAAAPGLAPAAVFAAEAHAAAGEGKKAARILREAWRVAPQPAVAEAFAALAPDETPAERRRRFRDLLSVNETSPESALLAAELAIADHDWAAARRALGGLAETNPTHRSLAMMAAVEKGEGAPESVVRGYLARAITAPRGAHWVCEKCAAAPGHWSAVCPSCGSFDTLSWRETASEPEAFQASMLPLIVDPAEDKAREDALDAEAAEEAVREAAEARETADARA
jgi:HemY protein